MMNRNFNNLVLLGFALALVSCAKPEIKTPEPPQHVEIKSKPVKMPPKLKKLGKSIGIGLDEFYTLQQSGNVLIYDVRVPNFYAIDHIPGALNWPHDKYEEQVQMRDIEIQTAQAAGKKVVLYCFSMTCAEARNVARKLALRDYEVYVLTMGIDTWREAGLPLIKAGE
ncbi:MAG: rhodanese-like domain-containing protein [Akkermansiaceae bacterium]